MIGSANHGQSWFKAVCFTLGFGLVFFILAYLPNLFLWCIHHNHEQPVQNLWYSLGRFFIPVDYSGIIAEESQKTILIQPLGIPAYILGKITIAYGAVEIVQAFRKLK